MAQGFGQSTFPKEGITQKNSINHLYTNAIIHIEPGLSLGGDLLIGNGRIMDVGELTENEIPPNTVVIDLNGTHVFPSFIELDAEYGLPSKEITKKKPGPQSERSENKVTYWNESFHPEVSAAEEFNPNVKSAQTLLKMGFGMALTHRHDGIGRGTSALTMVGEGKANELIINPEAAMHFSFEKGSATQDYPRSLMGAIALLRQAFYDAAWYGESDPSEYNLSLEAINEHSDLPWFFHIREANDLLRVQRLANEFELKVAVVGVGDSYKVIGESESSIELIVSPIKLPEPFDMSDPDLGRLVSQSDLLHWERAPFNPRVISSSGKSLVLSSEGLKKPKELFSNLRKIITSGLHPDSAFASLTTNPSRYLGATEVGKIKAGYLANFFVADKNPFLEDGAQVLSHFILGKEAYRSDTDQGSFEGRYDLNIDDTYFELSLRGENPKKGEILYMANDDTLKSEASFSGMGNQVVLSFKNPSGEGLYRLSAVGLTDNRIWDGMGTDPLGKEVNWTAIRQKSKPKKASESDSLSVDSLPPIPPVYYPYNAYGHDSLPEQASVLIQNATIWTSDSLGVIQNGTILISRGKIIALGKSIDASELENDEFLEIIDGTGKHITPGIIDEHSHIAITRGVNEGTQSNTAEVRIADAVDPDDINIYRQLAGGVTTAQLLHGSANPIGGQSAIIKLRWGEDFDDMLFDKAPGFMKFALGENVKQSNWGDDYNERYPQTRMGVEQFMYNEFYRAGEYGQLKRIHEAAKSNKRRRKRETKPDPFRTDLELEALLEVLNSERFITCHSYVQSEINMLMHLADSMGFTLNTFTHILEGYKVADKMKAHGAAASTFSDWWAYKFEVKDAIPHNASILNHMGVLTAINSDDAEMARRLNQEAAKAIRYGGMSEEEALKLVTLNPAKMLHIDEYTGSLLTGKDADIVIWDGHPLSVYSKVLKTFVDGKLYFDRQVMETRRIRDKRVRTEIADKMNEASTGGEKRKPARTMERYYHCDSKD